MTKTETKDFQDYLEEKGYPETTADSAEKIVKAIEGNGFYTWVLKDLMEANKEFFDAMLLVYNSYILEG